MKKRKYRTYIRAIDPADGKLKLFSGPNITATDMESAEEYASKKYGYLEVVGEAVNQ